MPSRGFYNAPYRVGAPWGGAPRAELVELFNSGRIAPTRFPRAIDLGCGTGEDSLFLASKGFDVVGIDFSSRALQIARRRAQRRGLAGPIRFVEADLTDKEIHGVEGTFHFLFDGGSLDDLQGKAREAAAETVHRLSHPGSMFLMWCFFGRREDLPWISFVGPSKLGPGFEPGEPERLFGAAFDIERLDDPFHRGHWACFLMTKKAQLGFSKP